MLMNYLIISFVPLLMCIFISVHRVHFLCVLLYFEGAIVSLLFLIGGAIKLGATAALILVLTFGASEAALGLGLLILICRSFGGDMLSSLSAVGA